MEKNVTLQSNQNQQQSLQLNQQDQQKIEGKKKQITK